MLELKLGSNTAALCRLGSSFIPIELDCTVAGNTGVGSRGARGAAAPPNFTTRGLSPPNIFVMRGVKNHSSDCSRSRMTQRLIQSFFQPPVPRRIVTSQGKLMLCTVSLQHIYAFHVCLSRGGVTSGRVNGQAVLCRINFLPLYTLVIIQKLTRTRRRKPRALSQLPTHRRSCCADDHSESRCEVPWSLCLQTDAD